MKALTIFFMIIFASSFVSAIQSEMFNINQESCSQNIVYPSGSGASFLSFDCGNKVVGTVQSVDCDSGIPYVSGMTYLTNDWSGLPSQVSYSCNKQVGDTYSITAPNSITSQCCETNLKGNQEIIKEVSCTDTDGKDPYTKGKVTLTDPNVHQDGSHDKTTMYEDECLSSTRLKEYICVDNNNFQSTETECSYGCANGVCLPFYSEEEEIGIPEEEIESSVNFPSKSCKTLSEACAGSDKIIKEECAVHIQKNNACEESTITNTKILKNACAEEKVTPVTVCQGCQIDKSTCIPFGTRLEKQNIAYYCDISKKMTEQKQDKQSCQNSYECSSNNCKAGLCAQICEGCLDENNVCIPISTRTGTQYCDIDYDFKNQKSEEMTCNNNYECSANLCVNNKCISPSFIQKIIDWFSKLFGG